MKQHLVLIHKSLSNCGFDLCPKKYKYLADPVLLDKVFSSQVPQIELEVKRPRHLDENDSMHTTNCIECKVEFLLPIATPVCTSCRGVYQ